MQLSGPHFSTITPEVHLGLPKSFLSKPFLSCQIFCSYPGRSGCVSDPIALFTQIQHSKASGDLGNYAWIISFKNRKLDISPVLMLGVEQLQEENSSGPF